MFIFNKILKFKMKNCLIFLKNKFNYKRKINNTAQLYIFKVVCSKTSVFLCVKMG